MADPQSRAPIVLVPGLLGFDRVRLGPLTFARYFPGIEEELTAAGYRVATARLSQTRGIAHRAGELRNFVERRFPKEPIHLIGHSMGGLDARYMISRLDMANRVRSLTTIGTPHHGSTFADWAVGRFRRALPILNFLGLSTEAFHDLTTDACARFNASTPDAVGVTYHSVAGRCDYRVLAPFWRPSAGVVSDVEGPNDGVVSVQSATYGESRELWDGDHMNLVNRPNPRATGWGHRPTDYVRLARRVEP